MHPSIQSLRIQLEATDRLLDSPTLSATTRAYLNAKSQSMRKRLNGQAN